MTIKTTGHIKAKSIKFIPTQGVDESIRLDGNAWLERDGTLTSVVDSNAFTTSIWFRVTSDFAGDLILTDNTNSRVLIKRRSGDQKIDYSFADSGGSSIGTEGPSIDSYTDILNVGWHNLLMAYDGASTTLQFYIDDVDASTADIVIISDRSVDFATTDTAIGALLGGSSPWRGELSEYYFNTDEFVDLSITSNRRKFIDASGKPVDLGSDGSTPTGSQPAIFLTGPAATYNINKGYGGNFVVKGTGQLARGLTSPFD